MEIKELIEKQKKFQEEFFSKLKIKTEKDKLRYLEFITLAMAGEMGEFANLVKKAIRDNLILDKTPGKEMISHMKEELADIFIYFLLALDHLDVDIEKEVLSKMEKNKARFQVFKEA